tara:strand:- start:504 stop:851 length:348 start_codon:yes stop_codon:yes gene_type:complete
MNIFQLVQEFHEKYGLKKEPNNFELQRARIRHMIEEMQEYVKGHREGDREQQLDALVDLVYVALGTAYYEGFDFNKAFKEVHECNMKKIQKATERSKWDVVKPEGWKAPNLKEFV